MFPKALDFLIIVSAARTSSPLFARSRYFTLYVAAVRHLRRRVLFPLVVVFLELAGVVPSAQVAQMAPAGDRGDLPWWPR